MGIIKLNLKARSKTGNELLRALIKRAPGAWRMLKKDAKEMRRHIGIKTARQLVNEFRRSGNLCPVVIRNSFSSVTIQY